MTEFENYLEKRIEALEAEQSGASGLPALPDIEGLSRGDELVLVVGQDPAPEAAVNATFGMDPGNLTADGGSWTFTYDGDTTAGIAFDTQDGFALIATLEALPSIGAGNVNVLNSAINDGVGVEFIGDFAGQPIDIELLSADGSGLTGPDSPYTIEVVSMEEGAPAVPGGTKLYEWSASGV